jgi:hypothetical protein
MLPGRARWAALLSVLVIGGGSAAAADLDEFARCVTRSGATYYRASWCPHCAQQDRMFGAAIRNIRSVDCSDGCRTVHSFPTWEFARGQRVSGVLSLNTLASRSGCALDGRSPQAPAEGAERARGSSWSAVPTREHDAGGAKVIEIR